METDQEFDPTIEVTSGQLRAARALLGWSREHAARECGVGWATLGRLERDERTPHSSTVEGLILTFEANGIRFFREGKFAGAAIADRETEAVEPE